MTQLFPAIPWLSCCCSYKGYLSSFWDPMIIFLFQWQKWSNIDILFTSKVWLKYNRYMTTFEVSFLLKSLVVVGFFLDILLFHNVHKYSFRSCFDYVFYPWFSDSLSFSYISLTQFLLFPVSSLTHLPLSERNPLSHSSVGFWMQLALQAGPESSQPICCV